MCHVFVSPCRETSIRAIALHPRLPYVAVGRQVRKKRERGKEGGREGGREGEGEQKWCARFSVIMSGNLLFTLYTNVSK